MTALRKHLKQGPRASLQPALGLGRQAVALGLETLDLARIHEQALATLELSNSKNGFIKRAEIFFTEAITPIVETHRAARQSKVRLEPAERRRWAGARWNWPPPTASCNAASSGARVVEDALKKSGEHYTKLLEGIPATAGSVCGN